MESKGPSEWYGVLIPGITEECLWYWKTGNKDS